MRLFVHEMYVKELIQNAEDLSLLVNNVFLTLLDWVEVAVKQTAMCMFAQVDIPVLFQKFKKINIPLHFPKFADRKIPLHLQNLQR